MLPAEHKGNTEFRKWYKVKWLSNPYPGDAKWNGIEGKADLVMDEDFVRFKDHVEILESARVKKCTTGLAIGFGKLAEGKIDEWMKANKT